MPTQIILDLSRLVFASWSRTPAGIPRVELAYAEHFIENSPANLSFAVLDAFGRLRTVRNRRAIAFVTEIARYWRGDVASNWAHLRLMLRALHIHTLLLLRYGGGLIHRIERYDGRTIYIIPSQLHMERTSAIERLKKTGKVQLIYFVHDIIPVVFPEYFPPRAEERTRRRMKAAARLADVVIVNSQHTADTFRRMFDKDRRADSIVVAPLGLSVAIPRELPRNGRSTPYFVMIGTIEPRKNHLLILNLWRALRTERGADSPRLILIGCRGWENENIVDMLDRSPSLRGFVEERGRVSDEEMTRTLLDARALLMPSFAEGYGLPLAETLALGIPALCSDLPALREVGGNVPEFIDPLDGLGWRSAILDYCSDSSTRRQAQLNRLVGWRTTSWESHFGQVSELLEKLEATSIAQAPDS